MDQEQAKSSLKDIIQINSVIPSSNETEVDKNQIVNNCCLHRLVFGDFHLIIIQ